MIYDEVQKSKHRFLKTTQSTLDFSACNYRRNFSNFSLIVAISYLFLDAFQCPGLRPDHRNTLIFMSQDHKDNTKTLVKFCQCNKVFFGT